MQIRRQPRYPRGTRRNSTRHVKVSKAANAVFELQVVKCPTEDRENAPRLCRRSTAGGETDLCRFVQTDRGRPTLSDCEQRSRHKRSARVINRPADGEPSVPSFPCVDSNQIARGPCEQTGRVMDTANKGLTERQWKTNNGPQCPGDGQNRDSGDGFAEDVDPRVQSTSP